MAAVARRYRLRLCLEPESVDDVDYAFLNENTSQLRSVLL